MIERRGPRGSGRLASEGSRGTLLKPGRGALLAYTFERPRGHAFFCTSRIRAQRGCTGRVPFPFPGCASVAV
ncbi:hypothetical protein NDU88_010745 [Pleurodeles waltl]|uniref:Uncharacterized protein n=1 Tax=Pleurodeles waltl TaxID=8319 RepID=A0AAV7S0I4_PLEWA|nr:hypothetical protein NDU88_010745 [Pleurodeles waltl]